jgi:hypothetical protein
VITGDGTPGGEVGADPRVQACVTVLSQRQTQEALVPFIYLTSTSTLRLKQHVTPVVIEECSLAFTERPYISGLPRLDAHFLKRLSMRDR